MRSIMLSIAVVAVSMASILGLVVVAVSDPELPATAPPVVQQEPDRPQKPQIWADMGNTLVNVARRLG
jgi:hypothetical protein